METKFTECPVEIEEAVREVALELASDYCTGTEALEALREVFEPLGYSVALCEHGLGVARPDGMEIATIWF